MNNVKYDHWVGFHKIIIMYAVIAAVCVTLYHKDDILNYLTKITANVLQLPEGRNFNNKIFNYERF